MEDGETHHEGREGEGQGYEPNVWKGNTKRKQAHYLFFFERFGGDRTRVMLVDPLEGEGVSIKRKKKYEFVHTSTIASLSNVWPYLEHTGSFMKSACGELAVMKTGHS